MATKRQTIVKEQASGFLNGVNLVFTFPDGKVLKKSVTITLMDSSKLDKAIMANPDEALQHMTVEFDKASVYVVDDDTELSFV